MNIGPALAILLALSATASAQAVPAGLPSPATLAERAAKRFPQPVRVGDLLGRKVLEPEEAQPVLGRVESLAPRGDGVDVIIRTGARLGFGGRLVAVPVEAVALLGEHVALLDYTPAQLAALPTVPARPGLPADATIRVGLTKPFH